LNPRLLFAGGLDPCVLLARRLDARVLLPRGPNPRLFRAISAIRAIRAVRLVHDVALTRDRGFVDRALRFQPAAPDQCCRDYDYPPHGSTSVRVNAAAAYGRRDHCVSCWRHIRLIFWLALPR
jgi:hypothetical protein